MDRYLYILGQTTNEVTFVLIGLLLKDSSFIRKYIY